MADENKFSRKRIRKLRRRGDPRTLHIIIIACVCVGFLYFGLRPAAVQSKPTTQVRIATDDDMVQLPTPVTAIARGQKLGTAEYAMTSWPKSKLRDKYVQNIALYPSASAVTALPAGLPIPVSALSSNTSDANAVIEGIPSGMRAITVRVDAESAVEGWARSGSYVDVILIKAQTDGSGILESKVIAENVKILSAGQSAEPLRNDGNRAPKAPTTVTLLVTQKDGLRIKTASNIGKLTFALRGLGDQDPAIARVVDQRTLMSPGRTLSDSQRQKRYRGVARGPDGNVYLLLDDREWVRKLGDEKGPDATSRAKLRPPVAGVTNMDNVKSLGIDNTSS